MSRFWRAFMCWFGALLIFFVMANPAGIVRPRGLLPYRFTGFSFTVAEWGFGVEEFFDWSAIYANAVVALGVSGVVGCVCALARSRDFAVSTTSPDAEPSTATGGGA